LKAAPVTGNEDLVSSYLAHARAVVRKEEDEHFWSFGEIHTLTRDDPERAWPLVCEIVAGCTDDALLAYVAAGPLEDLLCNHPARIIDRVEELARRDAHFRRCLSGVWASNRMPDDTRRRIDSLLGDEPRL
jgi:hypothetical protein